jgi:hypothetical protein
LIHRREEPVVKRLVTIMLAIGVVVALTAPAGATTRQVRTTSSPADAVLWTRWVFEAPADQSPLVDPANCDARQSGFIRFLPPATQTDQTTSCTIPVGASLVVSPGGNIATRASGDGSTVGQLRSAARASVDDITDVSVTLDGIPLDVSRLRSPVPFVLRLPVDNVLDAPSGPTLAAVDGFFIRLRGLSIGHHVITESDTFISDGTTASLTADVTVTPRSSAGG